MHARSFTAVPLICIFGLARLFLFNEGSGFGSDDGLIVGLTCALLIHRICWVPLLALGLKWPKLYRFYHYYEMLAMVLDSVLSLSESKTPAAQNFALMYLLLMNVLVFSVLYYHILENLAAVLFHATAVKIILHSGLHISSICPPTY